MSFSPGKYHSGGNSDHVTLALWLGTVRHTLHGRVYGGISPGDLFHSNSFATSASLMEVYALLSAIPA